MESPITMTHQPHNTDATSKVAMAMDTPPLSPPAAHISNGVNKTVHDMDSLTTRISPITQALEDVNEAVQADKTGRGVAHNHLINSIHKLRLAAEAPAETLYRGLLEVTLSLSSPQCDGNMLKWTSLCRPPP